MNRRTFLLASCAVSASMPGGVPGQSAERPRHVGILFPGRPSGISPEFVDLLRQRGWIVGENFLLERRFATKNDELPALARELVDRKVDLIITNGTPATKAAMRATKTIPILFQVGADPVEQGLVKDWNEPGGNLTGVVFGSYNAKMLEILKDAVPKVRRVMYAVETPTAETRDAAKALGIQLVPVPVPDADHLDDLYAAVRKQRPDGVVVPNVSWISFRWESIGRAMAELRVPAIGMSVEFVKGGGLLGYTPVEDFARLVAKIDALLRGENPAKLPVERPSRYRTAINRTTATNLGLSIPRSFEARVTDVID
jgi:putative ABC transport system substrate-binding protein